METTKRKTESRTKENRMMAKRQAEQMGIVLTRRRNNTDKKSTYGLISLYKTL